MNVREQRSARFKNPYSRRQSRSSNNMRNRYNNSVTQRRMQRNRVIDPGESMYKPKSRIAQQATRINNFTQGPKASRMGMRNGGRLGPIIGRVTKRAPNIIAGVAKQAVSTKSLMTVGVLGMTAAAFTRGMLRGMNDSIIGRYLKDQRNSSAMNFGNTRVGLTGTRTRTSVGNHVGLALSMSKTRHGRR